MAGKRQLQGTVVSDKMDKTVVVSVIRHKEHRLYRKVMTLTKKVKAHDEANACRLGDLVVVEECRPMSREKRWRVVNILARGDVAEIQPEAIGREIEETAQIAPKAEARLHDGAEAGGGHEPRDPEERA
ncbi:MAG: 30S ribosomal protein S17 [Dehalococcoidia bacterium]